MNEFKSENEFNKNSVDDKASTEIYAENSLPAQTLSPAAMEPDTSTEATEAHIDVSSEEPMANEPVLTSEHEESNSLQTLADDDVSEISVNAEEMTDSAELEEAEVINTIENARDNNSTEEITDLPEYTESEAISGSDTDNEETKDSVEYTDSDAENTSFVTEADSYEENTDSVTDSESDTEFSDNDSIDTQADVIDGESESDYEEDGSEKTHEDDLSGEDEENDEKEDESSKIGNRFIDSLFDFIELFIFSLAAVFILTTFFFRHSVVDGSSMERTLFDGEHVIISDFLYKPQRGDIIVCEDFSLDIERMRNPIVKRVIAIAGDTVEIDKDGNVIVNGEMLEEDYVYICNDPRYPWEPQPMGPIEIKEGEVFVMGDHRNASSDSRAVGPIKEDSILGKVLFRFYPYEKFGKID